ncbi:MAG: hydroxyisourate hydrolase [Pseudomonadota bacterium]
MGKLTTHILDTANGKPAVGVNVRLYRIADERELCASLMTNDDGRTAEPLLLGDEFVDGVYELEFDIGDYFAAGNSNEELPFLGTVVIRVSLKGDQSYHVPLLATPWSYSTYRGS